ncbi:hypothetical protein WR25_08798 [Diploscapter pachys]|uniref:Uncharacterized protein n=1 Tax=Diploscapter pachys TaxID=2018661 RepID=A0A2A2L1X1_9BILA|nr:hypothetical protein WR25_08798 [Diploscapter pachys]
MHPRFIEGSRWLFYSICITIVATTFTICGTFTTGWVNAYLADGAKIHSVSLTLWQGSKDPNKTFAKLPSWLQMCIIVIIIAFVIQLLVLVVWYPIAMLLRWRFAIKHRYGIGALLLAGLLLLVVCITFPIKWDSYYPHELSAAMGVPPALMYCRIGYSYILAIVGMALTFLNVAAYIYLARQADEPL